MKITYVKLLSNENLKKYYTVYFLFIFFTHIVLKIFHSCIILNQFVICTVIFVYLIDLSCDSICTLKKDVVVHRF